MPISLTDNYKINRSDFLSTGAFDIILDVDSRLFIDPALLKICEIDEFKQAKQKVEKFFSDIILLISNSINKNDMYWKKADKLLSFKELTGTCFGYSQFGTNGNSIGAVLRDNILNTIKELIAAGEKNPAIFELLGVFQEGIGCDRISDLLTFILAPEIMSFTQRTLNKFNLCDTTVIYKNVPYKTTKNFFNKKPILLLPSSLLTPLPIAYDYDDIDRICMENDRVRQEINAYFDLNNRKKLSKEEIYSLMLNNSSFRKALITAYSTNKVIPYNFENDPVGEYAWYSAAKQYVSKFPLELQLAQKATTSDVLIIVEKIYKQYKSLIEDNGLWRLLYDDNNQPKHERAAQLLFFGIADAYCEANNIDLSREIDSGRGFVDFKLSYGALNKILVEIKLTSNTQLLHGFTTQLPIYMKQEKTQTAIYLVIDNGNPTTLKNFTDFYFKQPKEVKNKIKYFYIDGKMKKSASKA